MNENKAQICLLNSLLNELEDPKTLLPEEVKKEMLKWLNQHKLNLLENPDVFQKLPGDKTK